MLARKIHVHHIKVKVNLPLGDVYDFQFPYITAYNGNLLGWGDCYICEELGVACDAIIKR